MTGMSDPKIPQTDHAAARQEFAPEDVYVCPYCGHLLAFVSEVVWDDHRKEPHDGTWACPSCHRAQCSLCKREAKTHRWGYDSGGSPNGAQFTYRDDVLLCGPHEGGYKRSLYDRPLRNVEPLSEWLERGSWTTPPFVRDHAQRVKEANRAIA